MAFRRVVRPPPLILPFKERSSDFQFDFTCVSNQSGQIIPPEWAAVPSSTIALECLSGGQVYNISSQAVETIGRNEKCSVVVDNIRVSRFHAAIVHHHSGDVYLSDLGSSHGTHIGHQRLTPFTMTLLKPNSIIRFGSSDQYIIRNGKSQSFDAYSLKYKGDEDNILLSNTQTNRLLYDEDSIFRCSFTSVDTGDSRGSADSPFWSDSSVSLSASSEDDEMSKISGSKWSRSRIDSTDSFTDYKDESSSKRVRFHADSFDEE